MLTATELTAMQSMRMNSPTTLLLEEQLQQLQLAALQQHYRTQAQTATQDKIATVTEMKCYDKTAPYYALTLDCTQPHAPTIYLDSPQWFAWLEAPENDAFSYVLHNHSKGYIDGFMTVRLYHRDDARGEGDGALSAPSPSPRSREASDSTTTAP